MVTEFTFDPDPSFQLEGGIRPINPMKGYDEIFEGDYTYFKKSGEFRQTIIVKSQGLNISGTYTYQVCSDIDGKCIPFEDDFSDSDFNISVLASESRKNDSENIGASIIPTSLNDQVVSQGILHPAEWNISFSDDDYNVNDEIDIVFRAIIDSNWYLYSSDFDPDLGPMVTEFNFDTNSSFELIEGIEAINPSKGYDEIFEGEYTYFKSTGEFRQRIKVLRIPISITGSYTYQVCSDIDGKCIPFDEDFKLGEAADLDSDELPASVADITPIQTEYEIDRPEDKSMAGFIIFAFISGLIALLTPCVFPMIPMTVTFFLKDNEGSREQGIRKALIFGLSIVIIFTVLGMLIAVLFGAETLNQWATHWFPNVFIFVVFMVFAASFLGLFELTLPHSWVNKVDRKADQGGLGGVFFMAATLTLVSFSCTFPIVGSVLVLSTQGQFIKPVLGMFAFSMAFALPFTLFAAFPEWLKSMPKSGGWLNSVKVVLGFLELALGLKFLSVADQAYHWGLLDREVYLALWIVIFALLGFYLLGKIRLSHDSKVDSVGVPRLMLSIITFSFVIYLIPGLWGAPLKALAGYLPPITTHDFNLVKLLDDSRSSGYSIAESDKGLCETPKYADLLEFPHGIEGYFDYEQAIACARQQNKPLFIDFTGHGCVNCREMEARVWSDPKVLHRLKNDFVVVALYVDDKKLLPESEWFVSDYDGKVKKTIGKQNADFQISRYNNNAQPFYVILDQEEQLLATPLAYNLGIQNFVDFLDGAKTEYYNRQAMAKK
jgi:thiol:disulfide interchange protein DsbD